MTGLQLFIYTPPEAHELFRLGPGVGGGLVRGCWFGGDLPHVGSLVSCRVFVVYGKFVLGNLLTS